MNPRDLQLKQDIMRRVHTIHTVRQVVKPFVVKGILCIASLMLVNSLISIPHVLTNMRELPSLGYYTHYLATAFVHTKTIVQISLLLTCILFFLFLVDLSKNIRATVTMRFS